MNGLSFIQDQLQAQKRDLLAALKQRDGICIERSPDVVEDLLAFAARNMSAQDLDRCTAKLHDTEAALKRLGLGHYGICVDCMEPIPANRLNAVLEAVRCTPCQEIYAQDLEARAHQKHLLN